MLEAWKQERADSKLCLSLGVKHGLARPRFTDMPQWWAGDLPNGI